MAARGPGPRQAQRNAPSQRLALAGQQGRIGGDDGDDRARPRRRLEPEIAVEPVAVERIVVEQLRTDMPAGDGQFGARTEVRLDERGHGEGRVAVVDHPRRGAVAALEVVAVHPGAAADRALGDGPGGRGVERGLDVLGPARGRR